MISKTNPSQLKAILFDFNPKVIPESPHKDYTTTLPPFSNNYESSKSTLATFSTTKQPFVIAHFQHVHICLICYKKDIPYVFLSNKKHTLTDLNLTLVIQGFLTHIACILLLKLKYSPQSNPLTQKQ
ncbi:705_t:CDS:2 [Gigaspora margarita]|uniref:705_t:CDS:1 n=1 Tax=Gigaspora margarita TaxID=4874 RepID=A0ABN7VFQ4_GIGMA|nr:705_t:CDS:2 [Gigaspora margarita]